MSKKNTKPVKRYLGIDPGTQIMGYAMIEVLNNKTHLLEMGVIHLNLFSDPAEKLKKIFERIHHIITEYQPDEMAIEAPFYGKNAQAMLKLGRAQGVAMTAAIVRGIQVTEYAPRKIKQSVTGNGNASKEQVAAILQQTLKFDLNDHYLDATDALGVALCHHYQSSSALGNVSKKGGWASFVKNNPDRVNK